MIPISWDDYFMTMVYLVSMRSKDDNTHIGAVVVGQDKEVRSVGYNGFPRGIQDMIRDRQNRPEKYFWFEHAERNVIYNATLMGVSLKGCIMYTNGVPCCDCARGVIQAGIREVVIDGNWDKGNLEKWREQSIRSLQMFKEAGVKVRELDYELIQIKRWRQGKNFDEDGNNEVEHEK